MQRPTTGQVLIGLGYAVLVVFTFYSLIISDEDYAWPLLLVSAVGGIAMLIPSFRTKPWLAGVIAIVALALAWALARFYFDGARY